jgi:hypothetical protein
MKNTEIYLVLLAFLVLAIFFITLFQAHWLSRLGDDENEDMSLINYTKDPFWDYSHIFMVVGYIFLPWFTIRAYYKKMKRKGTDYQPTFKDRIPVFILPFIMATIGVIYWLNGIHLMSFQSAVVVWISTLTVGSVVLYKY